MLDPGLPYDRRSYGLLRGRVECDRPAMTTSNLQEPEDRRLRIR
jgi:hypothetical protein